MAGEEARVTLDKRVFLRLLQFLIHVAALLRSTHD